MFLAEKFHDKFFRSGVLCARVLRSGEQTDIKQTGERLRSSWGGG